MINEQKQVFIGTCEGTDEYYFEEEANSIDDLPDYCPYDYSLRINWRLANPEEISGDISQGAKPKPEVSDVGDSSEEDLLPFHDYTSAEDYKFKKDLLRKKKEIAKRKETPSSSETTRPATPGAKRSEKLYESLLNRFLRK
jgi:hypothetical protein